MVLNMLSFLGDLVGRVFDGKSEKLSHAEVLAGLALVLPQAQMKVNAVEAGSSSLFVAGWRPFIGWMCGSILGADALFQLFGFSGMDTGSYVSLLLGLLGMGGLRTYEKSAGIKDIEPSAMGKKGAEFTAYWDE